MRAIRVRDVATDDELKEFEKLNFAVLTSATKMERDYYSWRIGKIINKVKDRYFNSK